MHRRLLKVRASEALGQRPKSLIPLGNGVRQAGKTTSLRSGVEEARPEARQKLPQLRPSSPGARSALVQRCSNPPATWGNLPKHLTTPRCSWAKPASCDSFSRTYDLPVLFPTASIQNHHKFKLSVIKQPELPSQLSPLRYRPEGTPAPPLFSFPAPLPRSPGTSRLLRPGLPAGAPASDPAPALPARLSAAPWGAQARGGAELLPAQAPSRGTREEGGTGLGPAGARGTEEARGPFSFHQTPAPGCRSKPALPEQNAILAHRAGPSPAFLHRRGRATPQPEGARTSMCLCPTSTPMWELQSLKFRATATAETAAPTTHVHGISSGLRLRFVYQQHHDGYHTRTVRAWSCFSLLLRKAK